MRHNAMHVQEMYFMAKASEFMTTEDVEGRHVEASLRHGRQNFSTLSLVDVVWVGGHV